MPYIELFSERQKKLRGEVNDVYTYDSVPEKLRIQVWYIVDECIGKITYEQEKKVKKFYNYIYDVICREYGKISIGGGNGVYSTYYRDDIMDFIIRSSSDSEFLDSVDLIFKVAEEGITDGNMYYSYTGGMVTVQQSIDELNIRFRNSGLGYAFEGGELIRIDSQFMHSEVVKPTISLLRNSKFAGANEEYLKAHEHYKNGRNKECISECLKAFESTMKTICKEKGWSYNQNDTAKPLVAACFANELIPPYMQNQISALKNLLESGVPTIRNKTSGHGQGPVPQEVDDTTARYALNLTGANIIFLLERSGL